MENDVLTGQPREQENADVEQTVEGQELEGGQPQEGEGSGSPTESGTTHVPLKAYEEERKKRQDHKERADRAEERLRVYEEQQRANQQGQQPQDPFVSMQQQIINERFNTSEMIARSKYQDLDEKLEVFKEAAKANPALGAQMMQQTNPYDFAYKEAARIQLQRELGDDPNAYKARLEAEIREKVMAELGQGGTPQVKLPASLGGARSSAPRGAPAYTGPTPFDQVVNTR